MNKSETPYHPIPCAEYSRYECAIVQHQKLQLAWQGTQNMVHLHIVSPVDLFTRDSEEFIILIDEEKQRHQVRLDYILHCLVLNVIT